MLANSTIEPNVVSMTESVRLRVEKPNLFNVNIRWCLSQCWQNKLMELNSGSDTVVRLRTQIEIQLSQTASLGKIIQDSQDRPMFTVPYSPVLFINLQESYEAQRSGGPRVNARRTHCHGGHDRFQVGSPNSIKPRTLDMLLRQSLSAFRKDDIAVSICASPSSTTMHEYGQIVAIDRVCRSW